MTKDWHYAWQGESHGPVSAETMADLIRAGRLRADTLVWSEGMTNWDPASAHFDFGAPPPLPAGATGFGTQRMAQGLRTGATGIGPDGLYPGAPRRSFGEAIKVCFTKYITFKGRASRSEYWWFTLFTTLGSAVGGVLEAAMGNDGAAISGLFGLTTFLPSLAVTVRRLHDTDRSGWWVGGFYLAMIGLGLAIGVFAAITSQAGASETTGLGLLAIFGIAIFAYAIAMLVFMVQRGTRGPNRFG
ncbi:DUF805 domain-containing protein [Paenirhodobacter ferrireducens]|nr:DUF805 domain-containing protein [Sinirhodobacter ferrireducens]